MDSNYGVILCFYHHVSVVYKKHIFFLKSEKIKAQQKLYKYKKLYK